MPTFQSSVLFEKAVDKVIQLEGGYVNHPSDPGGETKFGISKKAYPHLDIPNLARHQAVEIYRRDYWARLPAGLSDDVRWFAFDSAVNHGVGTVLKWLQTNPSLDDLVVIRLRFYASLKTFPDFGRGWTRRVAEVLEAIRKEIPPARVEGGSTNFVELSGLTLQDRVAVAVGRAGSSELRGEFAFRRDGDTLVVRRV